MRPRARHLFGAPFSMALGASLLILDQALKNLSPVVWIHYRSSLWLAVIIVLMLVALIINQQISRHLTPLPVFLLLFGSLSNLFDLLIRGGVIDYWPWSENTNQIYWATNIADLMIWIGLVWLVLEFWYRVIWRRQL